MPSEQPTQRLLVDADRCQGHNRCHVLLPELITVDELGFAKARGDGRVPPELAEKARLAVRNCPEFALRLTGGAAGTSQAGTSQADQVNSGQQSNRGKGDTS